MNICYCQVQIIYTLIACINVLAALVMPARRTSNVFERKFSDSVNCSQVLACLPVTMGELEVLGHS